MSEITYQIRTSDRITVDYIPIACPVCGDEFDLCLTTAATGLYVTGSCRNGHIWDERRVPASEVRRIAAEIDRGRRGR